MLEASPSSLALAFAARAQLETERLDKLYAEFAGTEPFSLTDKVRTRRVILSAQRLDKLLTAGDDAVLKLAVERDYQYDYATEYLLGMLQTSPLTTFLRDRRLNRAARRIAEEITNQASDDSELLRRTDFIIRQIGGAKAVAEEKNVNPETVLQNEDLFAEVIRRSVNPSDFVNNYLPWQKRIASDANENLLSKLMVEFTKIHPMLNMVMRQKDSRSRRAQRFQPFQFSKLTKFGQLPSLARERAAAQVILSQVERFWGTDGLNGFSPEHRQALLMDEDI